MDGICYLCVCVCCHTIYSGRQVCRRTSRGHTHKEGHTGFLHLPSAVLTLTFLARRIQPVSSPRRPLSRTLCTNDLIVLYLLGILSFILFFIWWRKILVRVTIPRFELTSQRQKVSRLPTELQGRAGWCSPPVFSL